MNPRHLGRPEGERHFLQRRLAVESLAIESFDCVVLDLKLPGTSGFSMLEQVKKDDRFHNLPVIIYTGQELTWDQAMKSKTHLGPEEYKLGPYPMPAVAIPGQYRFT